MNTAIAEPSRPRWAGIIFNSAIHIAALLALLPVNFSWTAVGVAVFLHWLTGCLGITLGYHRLASHRSFQTPKWVEYFLIFCGTLACQGGAIAWVGYHRAHHLHSDQTGDPHNSNRGFWWSHMGWLMHDNPVKSQIVHLTKDIADDPFYQFCDRYFIPIQVVLAAFLYLVGGWPFVVWGIFMRMFVWLHSTCFVNSACHQFGYRTYDTGDRSTNCWWVALLSYGEGWHNNHHAFQYSARHGLQWWEIDFTWGIIRLLQTLGLATKVRVAQKSRLMETDSNL